MTTEPVWICSICIYTLCPIWNNMESKIALNAQQNMNSGERERDTHPLAPNNFYHKCAYFSIPANFVAFSNVYPFHYFVYQIFLKQFYYVRCTNGWVHGARYILCFIWYDDHVPPPPSFRFEYVLWPCIYYKSYIYMHIATYKSSFSEETIEEKSTIHNHIELNSIMAGTRCMHTA